MSVRSDELAQPGEGHVLLGRLGKTHGLAGGLHFRPLGQAEADALLQLSEVFVSGFGWTPIAQVKQHGSELIIRFENVRRIERARALVNAHVYAAEESLPAADESVGYVDALRGLPVLVDGEEIGTVTELIGVSGAELLSVERTLGGTVLLPLHAPYVEVTDEAVLVADPPQGLLEPEKG